MYFPEIEQRKPKELAPGVHARTFWGDRIMLAYVELDPGAVVPLHSHPHEQAGVVLTGELELTVDVHTRHLSPGDLYLIPGDVAHSAVALDQPVKVLDIFSPIREEYKA